MFLDHAVKCISYLKSRGVKTVRMACDMLLPNRRKSLGWLGDRLVDWITEERKENFEDDLTACVSNFNLLLYKLSYYTYSYVTEKGPYPQNFPGGALRGLLKYRRHYERAMYAISSMAKEAAAIFRDLATDPGCDRPMADRMAAECENYLCMVEDWLTLLTIYDLTQGGDQKKIAPLARAVKMPTWR